MKFFNLSVLVLVIVFIFSSCKKEECGGGSLENKELNLSQVTGVVNHTINTVTINQANEQKIEVDGYSHILEKLTSNVALGIVTFDYLNYDNYCSGDFGSTDINVSIPLLTYVELSKTGGIFVNEFADQGDVKIVNNRTGRIEFNSISGTEKLEIEVNSTGDIHGLSDLPDLQDLSVKINGTGDFEGFPVKTVNCTVVSDGTGKCEIYVTGELNVIIGGTGNVYYKGNPTNINLIDNGTGELIDAN